MSYQPGASDVPIPMVGPFSVWAPQFGPLATTQNPSNLAWESANRAAFFPVVLPVACVARRVWWVNGSTGGGNVSVAIYAPTPDGEPGAKIVECASTAQGTSGQVQFVDITDTALAPGLYWLALAASSTGVTLKYSTIGSNGYDAFARFQQASITVGALPATATPEESSSAAVWVFGFATTASP